MKTYSTLIGEYDNPPQDRKVISTCPERYFHLSDRRKSRYYKINSHLVTEEDTVYLDACLRLTKKSAPQINSDIAVFHHPNRNCLYKEAEICKKLNLGNPEQIEKQITRYQQDGFPKDLGLGENCYIIRKNNDKVREFNELWWQEYLNGSERDQLSFMYCVWKTGISLEFLEGNPRSNPLYTNWGGHLLPRTSQE